MKISNNEKIIYFKDLLHELENNKKHTEEENKKMRKLNCWYNTESRNEWDFKHTSTM
jgi:hypothetical protein